MFYKRALIKKENGDFKGAIADYNSAIALDSTYSEAIYNRAFTYKLLGDYTLANNDIDFILELPENQPEHWNMKGNLLILHGDMAEALLCFDRAISYDNNYDEAYYNRGIANLLFNRPIQACNDFEESSRLNYSKAETFLNYICGFLI